MRRATTVVVVMIAALAMSQCSTQDRGRPRLDPCLSRGVSFTAEELDRIKVLAHDESDDDRAAELIAAKLPKHCDASRRLMAKLLVKFPEDEAQLKDEDVGARHCLVINEVSLERDGKALRLINTAGLCNRATIVRAKGVYDLAGCGGEPGAVCSVESLVGFFNANFQSVEFDSPKFAVHDNIAETLVRSVVFQIAHPEPTQEDYLYLFPTVESDYPAFEEATSQEPAES